MSQFAQILMDIVTIGPYAMHPTMTTNVSKTKSERREFLSKIGLGTAAIAALTAAQPKRSLAQSATLAAQGLRRPEILELYGNPPRGTFPAPSAAVVALNRMAYGPRPGDVAAFNLLGATDAQRLNAYVDQQLNPGSIDDSEVESRLAHPNFIALNKSRQQLWADYVVPENLPWYERIRAVNEVYRSTLTRAVYSKRQLTEVLADFWHNHFNVYAWDTPIASVFVKYDQHVIRPNIMGNFRDMLMGTAQSITMLYYLDNVYNSSYGISDPPFFRASNENYGREVLELHTLGAEENYFGTIPVSQVPDLTDGSGRKAGYVEADVFEFSRCLCGWSIDGAWWDDATSTGDFRYRSEWHDDGAKQVMQMNLPGSGGQQEAIDVMDMLCEHPGTAQYVCGKLCRRFVGDNVSQTLIDQAAGVFNQNWDQANQLPLVYETILKSDEFRTTWGDKAKRPVETLTSSMRAVDMDWTIAPYDTNGDDPSSEGTLFWLFDRAGHQLFSWATPDGFPDYAQIWLGSTPLVMTWRTINWLLEQNHPNPPIADLMFSSGMEDDDPITRPGYQMKRMDVLGPVFDAMSPSTHTPNNLASFWYQRIMGFAPEPAVQNALATFMSYPDHSVAVPAAPGDLDAPIDLSDDSWPGYNQARMRAMVALILLAPEFLRR